MIAIASNLAKKVEATAGASGTCTNGRS